jgi:hypothetical protein
VVRAPYAREEIGACSRLIGLLLFANAFAVVLAQIPVAKLAEGRRRAATVARPRAGADAGGATAERVAAGGAAGRCGRALAAGLSALTLVRELPRAVRRTPAGGRGPSAHQRTDASTFSPMVSPLTFTRSRAAGSDGGAPKAWPA